MTDVFEPYLARNRFGTTAAQIRGFAETTTPANTSLSQILDELDTSRSQVRSTIDGAPADPTEQNVNSLSTKTRNTHRRGITFAAAMEYLADQVETHDSDIYGLATNHPDAEPDEARDLARPINNRLDGEGDDVAALLDGDGDGGLTVKDLILNGYIPLGAAGYWPNINANLTDAERRRARETYNFRNMTPEEQVTYIKEHEDIPFDVAAVISPTAARILADETAEDVENREIDEETVRILGLLAEQPDYATAFYSDVDPNEMGDAIKWLNDQAIDPIVGTVSDEDKLALYGDFMNAAGVALATHSRNTANPSDLADDWYDAIVDDENPENAAALTLLMREGGEAGGEYNATFIDELTSEVLDWERGHDGDAVWGPRATDSRTTIFDPDGSVDEHNGYYNGRVGTDGLANLLGAMGNSPEGAQRFFMNGDGSVDEDRLGYLMLERTFSGMDGSDEGDGLGEALQAATIGGLEGQSGDYTQDEADRLTNKLFDVIVNNSGINDHGDLGVDRTEPGILGNSGAADEWHVWTSMTDSLGAIASGYADDFYQVVGPGNETADTTLTLSESEMLRLVGEIGHSDDKAGLETLLASVANEGINREVGDQVAGYDSITELERSDTNLNTGKIGQVLGEMINASNDVQSSEEISEATRNAYVAKAFEFGTALLPGPGDLLGQGANDILVRGLDQAQGESISALQDSITAAPPATETAAGAHDAARSQMDQSLRYALANEFLEHGLLGEQTNGAHSSEPYPGVDGNITTTSTGGRVVFDPDLFYDRTDDEDRAEGDWEARSAAWNAFVDSNPYAIIGDYTTEATGELDTVLNQGG